MSDEQGQELDLQIARRRMSDTITHLKQHPDLECCLSVWLRTPESALSNWLDKDDLLDDSERKYIGNIPALSILIWDLRYSFHFQLEKRDGEDKDFVLWLPALSVGEPRYTTYYGLEAVKRFYYLRHEDAQRMFTVEGWGREFISAAEAADALLSLMERYDAENLWVLGGRE